MSEKLIKSAAGSEDRFVDRPRPGGAQSHEELHKSRDEDEDEDADEDEEDKDYEKAKNMPPWMEGKNKNKDEDEDDMEYDAKDKDDGKDKAKKSLGDESAIAEERLVKSLDNLEALAASSPAARKDFLLEKAKSDEGLTAEENVELYKALGGEVESYGLAEEVTKSLDPDQNSDLGATIDVTGYLGELNKSMQQFCYDLADRVEKSQNRQGELSLALCKGLADVGRTVLKQGQLIKSLQEHVNSFGQAPARGPKAKLGPGGVMQKSFAGGPTGEELSKSEISDTLDQMHKASIDAGQQGYAACGEDLGLAVTKFENGSQISPGLWQELIQYRRVNGLH